MSEHNFIHIKQLFEQVTAFHHDLAKALALYREDLIRGGFTREEAMTLVRDRQRILTTPPPK